MKPEIKFNHDADTMFEAMGVMSNDKDELASKIDKIVKTFISSDDNRDSVLAELLHQGLTYEEILFLAYGAVRNVVQDAMIEMLKSTLMANANSDLPN